jgi:hypothetical protein
MAPSACQRELRVPRRLQPTVGAGRDDTRTAVGDRGGMAVVKRREGVPAGARIQRLPALVQRQSTQHHLWCECSDAACTRLLWMRAGEYEALRSDTRLYAVLPGHERADSETLLIRTERFVVVRRQGRFQETASILRAEDRRPPG